MYKRLTELKQVEIKSDGNYRGIQSIKQYEYKWEHIRNRYVTLAMSLFVVGEGIK